MRDREHEQRVRDPGRLGADRRERLADLKKDEVAVLAERGECHSTAVAVSASRGTVRTLLATVPQSARARRIPASTTMVSRAPIAATTKPANNEPSGMAPQAMTRLALCTRPSRR